MTLNIGATMFLYAALFFAAGWGWGQWWAERTIRHERRTLEAGRLMVSMPAKPDDAANGLHMLGDLIKRAESDRVKAAAAAGY